MCKTIFLSGAVLLAGTLCSGADENQTESPKAEAGNRSSTTPADQSPVTQEPSADEKAIRQADAAFVQAYCAGDAKAIAELFTADAEYVDETGAVCQGRDAIEQSLTEFFSRNPDCHLQMDIHSIRMISPGVAVEDGSTSVTHADSLISVDSRYTTVYVKSDGKWLAASVRDHAPGDRREHRIQLQQLNWLMGDWVDEGDDAIVKFSCEAVDSGNFLLRRFAIVIAGNEAMTGTQRIGWDPVSGKLRAWIFDSQGGYGDGTWHRDSESACWILKTTGVLADGQTASSTSIYTRVNEDTLTWQTVDHEIAGVRQPDSEIYTIVRQAPAPLSVTAGDDQ